MKKQLNTFVELIKKYRYDNDINRDDLANQFGIDRSTLWRWEKGLGPPLTIKKQIESYINDKGTYLDPYELLTKELRIINERILEFTEYLKKFHE